MNKKQVIISGAVLLVLAVVVFIVGFSLGRSGGENDSKDKAGDDKKVVTEKVEKDKDLTEDSEYDKFGSAYLHLNFYKYDQNKNFLAGTKFKLSSYNII